MMCLFPAERGALTLGLIDALLYVSEEQRRLLEPQYRRILGGEMSLRPFESDPGSLEGWINAPGSERKLRWVMTGNYIDPREFPFRKRPPAGSEGRPLHIGRLSRPDPAKFPADFPDFYESLGLRNARFRVMAWTSQLAARWPNHVFDARWDLLPPLAETTPHFLQSLDLFVYSLHPTCRESWGRAVVEAMLCGAIPSCRWNGAHCKAWSRTANRFCLRRAAEFGRYARLPRATHPALWMSERLTRSPRTILRP